MLYFKYNAHIIQYYHYVTQEISICTLQVFFIESIVVGFTEVLSGWVEVWTCPTQKLPAWDQVSSLCVLHSLWMSDYCHTPVGPRMSLKKTSLWAAPATEAGLPHPQTAGVGTLTGLRQTITSLAGSDSDPEAGDSWQQQLCPRWDSSCHRHNLSNSPAETAGPGHDHSARAISRLQHTPTLTAWDRQPQLGGLTTGQQLWQLCGHRQWPYWIPG